MRLTDSGKSGNNTIGSVTVDSSRDGAFAVFAQEWYESERKRKAPGRLFGRLLSEDDERETNWRGASVTVAVVRTGDDPTATRTSSQAADILWNYSAFASYRTVAGWKEIKAGVEGYQPWAAGWYSDNKPVLCAEWASAGGYHVPGCDGISLPVYSAPPVFDPPVTPDTAYTPKES